MIKIPMTEILKKILGLVIWTLGNWNLFGIWDLVIEISFMAGGLVPCPPKMIL
jgi:hypothetical protein